MPQSKFLQYQDKNRDGLNDACGDLGIVPEPQLCLDCIPNPKVLNPNWRNRSDTEPYLNEKNCKYQITITTNVTSLIEATDGSQTQTSNRVTEIWKTYERDAAEGILVYFNKDDSTNSVNTIIESIEYTQYELDPRPNSHLKLLYSVPFEILNQIDDVAGDDEEDDDDESGDILVTYNAADLVPKMIKIRKGLNLYAKYMRVYRAVEKGNIKFVETRSIFNLENYGDNGLWAASAMANIILQLDQFLNQKGYNLAGTGGISFRDNVTKLKFRFDKNYKLKRLLIWIEECPEKAHIYGRKKLRPLLYSSAWRDPTATSYFAKLDKMQRDLEARVPKHWVDFLIEHTYPEVYSEISEADKDPSDTIGSCIAEALANEGKELGQDILDDVFSIGDAIAYMFHKNLCRQILREDVADKTEIGTSPGTDENMLDLSKVYAMATQQAFKRIELEEPVFAALCGRLLMAVGGMNACGQATTMADDLWEMAFDKIKLCGLFDLILDALACLMKGLNIEEAFATMLKSALQAMSIENFGDLFIGLPPEKQMELDALVKRKIEQGEFFKEGSAGQQTSDVIEKAKQDGNSPFFGKIKFKKPWEDKKVVEKDKEKKKDSPFGEALSRSGQQSTQLTQRTLAQQFDGGAAKEGLSPNVVMEAYFLALLEVYSDNYFELLDMLNAFPGARIVSFVIAMVDCPMPPIFNPSVMDFLKSIELPFCRNQTEITLPMLRNPFKWINDITDPLRMLWIILLWILQCLAMNIMMKLFVKICELIGDAICKAIEMAGTLAASLPALATGRAQFKDIIKESICGPNADDDQIEDTIADLFNNLGAAGAAFGNKEKVLSFTEDLSATVTPQELNAALLGDPSDSFNKVVSSLLDFEHPDIRDGLPNNAAIGSFFKNVGNLMPEDFKERMRDDEDFISDEEIPANPTLCATPEQIDAFKELRCDLLADRATQEQCDVMFKAQMVEDLGDLGDILQGGDTGLDNYIEANMPPLISEPGCTNGLLPFEPEETLASTTDGLDSGMQQLKVDFSTDMIGNGGLFGGDAGWGLINMILSDTKGNPLTAHNRLAFNRNNYVNFYAKFQTSISLFDLAKEGNKTPPIAPYGAQRGAYPMKVAEWLQDELQKGVSTDFVTNNESRPEKIYKVTFEDLEIGRGIFQDIGTSLLGLPDVGYNVATRVYMQNERIHFVKKARKKTPDFKMTFKDNARGLRAEGKSEFSYGFNLNFFLSDIVEKTDSKGKPNGTYTNRPDDNARIVITNLFNEASKIDYSDAGLYVENNEGDKDERDNNSEEKIIKERMMEFLSVDEGLDGVDLGDYPALLDAFNSKKKYVPQVVLLAEILGTPLASTKTKYDIIMSRMLKKFETEVGSNDAAFNYGGEFDKLQPSDLEYVVGKGQSNSVAGTAYADAKIASDDGDEYITNDDMILGISGYQHKSEQGQAGYEKNRVFYLDPAKYGGTYMNPPVYVKPMENKGWLGFVDVMFPELSPCKPQRTDLVDFGEIQQRINSAYPTISDDERLRQDPECVVELPYNRVLTRPAKAGIDGLISAACRIYGSVHFIKAMATFTTFNPDFENVYSSLFAQYIVENMERSFKDAQQTGWEVFTPFKDSEFWYAFLEQAVQTYGRRVDNGEIIPPAHVIGILTGLHTVGKEYLSSIEQDTNSLNDKQEKFRKGYPFREDLRDAKKAHEVGIFETLENYRTEQNYNAIKGTEEKAKLVLKEIVKEELNYMGKKFVENLELVGMKPTYYDLDYYFMDKFAQGGIDLDLQGEIKEVIDESIPAEGEAHYTGGGEFVDSDTNEEYIGYYHVSADEEGDTIYMAGEHPTPESQTILRPVSKKVKIPIGDIHGYPYTPSSDYEKPFVIEKYMRVNGTKMSPGSALSTILAKPPGDIVSDHFPGTLAHVYTPQATVLGAIAESGLKSMGPVDTITPINPATAGAGSATSIASAAPAEAGTTSGAPSGTDSDRRVVGLKGELGVRYGLQFSFNLGGKVEIVSVEIDALDTKISEVAPFDGDSELLFCLIKKLKENEKFRLCTRYIFPLNKLIATVAIYNDMAFLPSIGEVTVAEGDSFGDYGGFDMPGSKPGMYALAKLN